MLGLLRRDEGEPHRLCFAKKAAAFFKISRSSARMRFSLRKPRQLLALRGGQGAGLARAAIGAGPLDPHAQGRLGEVQLAGHLAHALALVDHQPDGAGFELIREAPPHP